VAGASLMMRYDLGVLWSSGSDCLLPVEDAERKKVLVVNFIVGIFDDLCFTSPRRRLTEWNKILGLYY